MKVYIGKYPNNHRNCHVHTNHMNKKYGYNWPETQTKYENFLEKVESIGQTILNYTINAVLHKLELKRTVFVKIDRSDTWSMDETLSHIILPMLIQLKRTKQGAPNVDNEDVPEYLQFNEEDQKAYNTNGATDDNFFKRWDYVLDEMIWAFNQNTLDDDTDQFYTHGVYSETDSEESQLEQYIRTMQVDREGLEHHEKRKANGFRLFGKYYQALWD